MRCPFCLNKKSKVVDKRDSSNVDKTRRRRECLKCEKRFTTYELIRGPTIVIIKKDGRREEFDKEKIKKGILKSCVNRPIKKERIEKMIDEIESELRNMKSNQIKTKVIGELVIKKLKQIDKVAYLRFASVYKEFKNVKSFEKEIKMIE